MNTLHNKKYRSLLFTDAVRDITGGNPKIKKSEYSEIGSIGIIDQGSEFIAGYTEDKSKICNAELPAIIFGDHTKIFKYVTTPFALGADGVKVLEPKVPMDKKFLFHCLKQVHLPNDAGYSRHFKFLKESSIVVPPLEEQKRIADILDKADALRRKRAEAIRLADEFLKSTFLDMFGDPVTNPMGWDSTHLGDVADIKSGVTKGRRFGEKETVFVPYMRVANVQDGHLVLDDIAKIEVLFTDVEKYLILKGDVLLTEGGDPDKLGRGAIWPGGIDNCIHQNHVFRVRVSKEHLVPEYASSIIGSARGKRYFLRSAKQTTGIASINMTQLRAFPILLPPIKLQQAYARFVHRFEKTRARLPDADRELDDMLSAISQKLFRESPNP